MTLLMEACACRSDGYAEASILFKRVRTNGRQPAPHRVCTASARSVAALDAAYERSVEGD